MLTIVLCHVIIQQRELISQTRMKSLYNDIQDIGVCNVQTYRSCLYHCKMKANLSEWHTNERKDYIIHVGEKLHHHNKNTILQQTQKITILFYQYCLLLLICTQT